MTGRGAGAPGSGTKRSDDIDRVAGGNASAFMTEAVRDKIARDAAASWIRDAYGEPDAEAYAHWIARAVHDLTIARTVYAAAFLAAANDVGIAVAVPAAALQEAWAAAERSGVLADDVYASGAFDAGAVHTVLVARERGWPLLSANPAPLRAIDPGLPVEILR